MSDGNSLTGRLRSSLQREGTATDELFEEILPELRKIAAWALSGEQYVKPLSQTELIHETWLRKLRRGTWTFQDRRHFFLLVSRAMRQVLVEEARRRLAPMRGGGDATLSLDEACNLPTVSREEAERAQWIVDVEILLERLEREDPDAVRMVELHCHGGHSVEEICEKTGLTVKQVRKRLERGIGWLRKKLGVKRGPSGLGFPAI